MDVVSVCPLQVASLQWMPRAGAHALTVVAKATFELTAGKAPLAEVQDFPNETDNHWNDDDAFSVYSPSDLAPFKPRADVMLVGDAFAPAGNPTQTLVARLIVGTMSKAIEVNRDRHFDQNDELGEGERFTRMALRYERAAGGMHTTNPVGIDRDGERDRYGRLKIPNIVKPGSVPDRNGTLDPIGFGPIAATWSTRRILLGRHAHGWSDAWRDAPMPTDIDGAFFQSAPLDQRLAELNENERITLENLHVDEPRLVCHLPGLKPVVFVDTGIGATELAMRADTLWVDTTRRVFTVTWRGRVDLAHREDPGTVFVSMSEGGQPVTWADVKRLAAAASISDDQTTDGIPSGDSSSEMPFGASVAFADEHTSIGIPIPQSANAPQWLAEQERKKKRPQAQSMQRLLHKDDQSPQWLRESQAPPAKKSKVEKTRPAMPVMDPLNSTVAYGGVSPWAGSGAAPAQAGSPAAGKRAPVPPPPPPPPGKSGPASTPSVPSTKAQTATPATGPSAAPPAPPPAPPPPPPPAAPRTAPPIAAAPTAAVPIPPPAATPVAPPPTRMPSAAPAPAVPAPVGANINIVPPNPAMRPRAQVADQSYDDVAPVAMHDRLSRQTSAEIVEVLWYDPECMDDVRARPGWGELFAESERKEDEADEPFDFDEEPPPEEDQETKDKRHIVAVMTGAHLTTGASLPHAMGEAVGATGNFEAPLIVMSGRLHFPFDELKRLKATLAAVTPLIAGNKDLGDAVAAVNELMSTPWLEQGSGDVANKLTDRVRDAFKRGDRLLDPSYLDDHTERILLEQRCYSMRPVFGDDYIRALMAPSAAKTKIPCYIPSGLIKELPMFTSLPARILAEAHVSQDQFESNEYALKVVAVGRIVQLNRPASY